MVGEAERAVAARDSATGEQIGRAVRALDPDQCPGGSRLGRR